ncbi:MAG: helix-turn-helix domain-containing protein [Candidatus Omnitrophota bacterium]
MPEKLYNIREVAEYLGVSEEEVKRLVDEGEVPAYKIGGTFLRFRKEQLDAVKAEIASFEEEKPAEVKPASGPGGKEAHPYTDMERVIKEKEPVTRQYDYTIGERVMDFFYFNDFYIVSLALVASLLYLILRT